MSCGKPITMNAVMFRPLRTDALAAFINDSVFIRFWISWRVRSLPLSGANASERPPVFASRPATSSSTTSQRVPDGNCQLMGRLRASSSLQNSMIQSRLTIAVRSWKGKLVAP